VSSSSWRRHAPLRETHGACQGYFSPNVCSEYDVVLDEFEGVGLITTAEVLLGGPRWRFGLRARIGMLSRTVSDGVLLVLRATP
jgi:hypothetical protein